MDQADEGRIPGVNAGTFSLFPPAYCIEGKSGDYELPGGSALPVRLILCNKNKRDVNHPTISRTLIARWKILRRESCPK